MQSNLIIRGLGFGATIAVTLFTAACGEDVPPFPEGTGQAAKELIAYPPAPFGVNIGSVISNYEFVGFANAVAVSNTMQAIALADFYNPHADDPNYAPASPEEDDRLFPPGSPYGEGTPKPKALLINIGSVWCPPCNEEAKSELPPRYAQYKPCGGEFLLQLADGPTRGTPATPDNLYKWTLKYKVNYPATLDPTYKLGAFYNAFPANILVDTRTMKILEIREGSPDDSFWALYEKTMDYASCKAQ